MAKGCQFLVEDCTMDGTDYDCEHPTYGTKYGCDKCPMFGRNNGKRQYRLVNPHNNAQPCGHPLSVIVHNGTTAYCSQCADDSLRENISKGIEA